MNLYFLLYISMYDFFRWFRKEDDPEFRAIVGFSLFVGINIILLSFLVEAHAGRSVLATSVKERHPCRKN